MKLGRVVQTSRIADECYLNFDFQLEIATCFNDTEKMIGVIWTKRTRRQMILLKIMMKEYWPHIKLQRAESTSLPSGTENTQLFFFVTNTKGV